MIFWKGWGIIGIIFPIAIAAVLASLGFSDENHIGITLSA